MKKKSNRYRNFAQAYLYLLAVSFDLTQEKVREMTQAHIELGKIIMELEKTNTKKERAILHEKWVDKMKYSIFIIPSPIATAVSCENILKAFNKELEKEGGFMLSSVELLP